jgi:enoyl-CoA hydratase/carnithine racemase
MPNLSQTPKLQLVSDSEIAWIIADNPPRMNALTAEMWKALPHLLAEAEGDDAIRVVVLRGAGERAFSTGADISEFESARTGAKAVEYDSLNHAAFSTLSACTKPTISMIHGFCLGGGLGLALATDIRLADAKAEFAIPAAKLGLGYNARWVLPLLAAVPPSRAKEMLFTGRRFKAAEGRNLEVTTRVLAKEIAANAPLTVRAAKRVVDEITRHPETPDMDALDAVITACFDSDDYAEGRRAFLEKRKPHFQGR